MSNISRAFGTPQVQKFFVDQGYLNLTDFQKLSLVSKEIRSSIFSSKYYNYEALRLRLRTHAFKLSTDESEFDFAFEQLGEMRDPGAISLLTKMSKDPHLSDWGRFGAIKAMTMNNMADINYALNIRNGMSEHDSWQYAAATRYIAQARMRLGDGNAEVEADELIEASKDVFKREVFVKAEYQAEAALHRFKKGHYSEAFSIAEIIEDGEPQNNAYSNMIIEWVKEGLPELSAIEDGHDLIDSLNKNIYSADAERALAVLLVRHGGLQSINTAVQRVRSKIVLPRCGSGRNDAIAAVAIEISKGEFPTSFEIAIRVAGMIEYNEDEHGRTLIEIIKNLLLREGKSAESKARYAAGLIDKKTTSYHLAPILIDVLLNENQSEAALLELEKTDPYYRQVVIELLLELHIKNVKLVLALTEKSNRPETRQLGKQLGIMAVTKLILEKENRLEHALLGASLLTDKWHFRNYLLELSQQMDVLDNSKPCLAVELTQPICSFIDRMVEKWKNSFLKEGHSLSGVLSPYVIDSSANDLNELKHLTKRIFK